MPAVSVWPRLAAPLTLALAVTLAAPPPARADGGKSAVAPLIQRGGALFEDQQYEESIQTLSAALLRSGASDAEKIETYRLLAYNYIILKRNEEADAAVRSIYVINEGFFLPPTESPRFREFFDAAKKKWVEEGKPGKIVAGAPPVVEKPIRIQHTSPAQIAAQTIIKLTGSIEDPDKRVRGVLLAYRTGVSGKFVTVSATYSLGQFRTQIPKEAVKPPLIEYYLQAVDKGGLPLASRGDAGAPLRVVVPKEGGVLSSPFFWVPVGLLVVGGAVAATVFFTRGHGTSTVTIGIRE